GSVRDEGCSLVIACLSRSSAGTKVIFSPLEVMSVLVEALPSASSQRSFLSIPSQNSIASSSVSPARYFFARSFRLLPGGLPIGLPLTPFLNCQGFRCSGFLFFSCSCSSSMLTVGTTICPG